MIVYVVIEGEYSDQNVVAVFTDEKLANKYIAMNSYGYYDLYSIEEHELDSLTSEIKKGKIEFSIGMDKDGTSDIKHSSTDISINKTYYLFNKDDYCGKKVELECYIIANSVEHAIKICNEMRTYILANNAWPTIEQYNILFKPNRYKTGFPEEILSMKEWVAKAPSILNEEKK